MNIFLKFALPLLALPLLASCARASEVTLPDAPTTLKAGATYEVTVRYLGASEKGIVQVQLVDAQDKWEKIAEKWVNVAAGNGEQKLSVKIPADARNGAGYLWQGLIYDEKWSKQNEVLVSKVALSGGVAASTKAKVADADDAATPTQKKPKAPVTDAVVEGSAADKALALDNISDKPVAAGNAEWRPAGEWNLEWSDEFNGEAGDGNDPKVTHWYPMLGWTPEDFKNKANKGLRWKGATDETAWFYSTKIGNHWIDGNGNLILRAVSDKTNPNENGPRVNTAYLQSGYPAKWDNTEPSKVKWLPGQGKFVSPKVNGEVKPLYISARVRSDQVKGYSTWFAFWLFSQTRAYNNKPADGTEVDMLEIVKGKDRHFNNFMNVANHWYPKEGLREDKYFNEDTTPTSTQFVNVEDSNYHTYGIEWSDKAMKCFVDGKLYYTFTKNIPTDPVDMMMMLTLEFQKNLWLGNAGDGRLEGPFVSDTPEMREMSRVFVDYVRVYRQQ